MNPERLRQFLIINADNSIGQLCFTPSFIQTLQNQTSKRRKPNESAKKPSLRSYNPGRPLAMNERKKILELYERGLKISHIARIIGVTHSCVSKIMTRYRRTGSMLPRSYLNQMALTSADEHSDSGSEASSRSTEIKEESDLDQEPLSSTRTESTYPPKKQYTDHSIKRLLS